MELTAPAALNPPDTNDRRKKDLERTRRRIEKYEFTVALMQTWEKSTTQEGHAYYLQLKMRAHKLRETLVIQGVL